LGVLAEPIPDARHRVPSADVPHRRAIVLAPAEPRAAVDPQDDGEGFAVGGSLLGQVQVELLALVPMRNVREVCQQLHARRK
jgi:hypothetical protein